VTGVVAEEPAPRPAAARGWAVVGVVGELLITVGVLLLLLVVYQLWWTNVEASQAADEQVAQLQEAWSRPPAPAPEGGGGGEEESEYEPPEFGSAFALMYIPRLSDKVWGTPIVEGVGDYELARGIGHYVETALPGEIGNFAVAAHRATNGEPFRDVDRLRVGDEVYVETRDAWYVYTLERDQIVSPQSVWVITPVPGEPGATPTEELITLTTCNPRWASYERWIWWGSLAETIDKDTGEVPDVILAGR
jgi:sortase A